MQNLSFRILDKLAVSTAPTETAFANATTITWGVSQEHIPYVGRHVNHMRAGVPQARVHGQTNPIGIQA